jgi:tubulin beta
MPSYAPIFDPKQKAYYGVRVQDLTTRCASPSFPSFPSICLFCAYSNILNSLFDKKNLFVAVDPSFGRYLTFASIFRGPVSSQEAEFCVRELQRKNSAMFIEWIPDNVSISLCKVPPVGTPMVRAQSVHSSLSFPLMDGGYIGSYGTGQFDGRSRAVREEFEPVFSHV